LADSRTLNIVYNLGQCLWQLGKLRAAETMFRRELKGCEQLNGPDDRSTYGSIRNLARILSAQGKDEEARVLMRRLRTSDSFSSSYGGALLPDEYEGEHVYSYTLEGEHGGEEHAPHLVDERIHEEDRSSSNVAKSDATAADVAQADQNEYAIHSGVLAHGGGNYEGHRDNEEDRSISNVANSTATAAAVDATAAAVAVAQADDENEYDIHSGASVHVGGEGEDAAFTTCAEHTLVDTNLLNLRTSPQGKGHDDEEEEEEMRELLGKGQERGQVKAHATHGSASAALEASLNVIRSREDQGSRDECYRTAADGGDSRGSSDGSVSPAL
jgi:hypothetical protein